MAENILRTGKGTAEHYRLPAELEMEKPYLPVEGGSSFGERLERSMARLEHRGIDPYEIRARAHDAVRGIKRKGAMRTVSRAFVGGGSFRGDGTASHKGAGGESCQFNGFGSGRKLGTGRHMGRIGPDGEMVWTKVG